MKRAYLYAGIALIGVGILMRSSLADEITSRSGDFFKYDAEFKAAAARYGIPNWFYLKAIAWNESNVGMHPRVRAGLANPFDIEGSKSSDGKSWGIMQVTLTTANDMRPGTSVADLNNPLISIDLGAKYYGKMYQRYKDPVRAARAYNQGPGNEDKNRPYADEYGTRFSDHLEKIQKIHA